MQKYHPSALEDVDEEDDSALGQEETSMASSQNVESREEDIYCGDNDDGAIQDGETQ